MPEPRYVLALDQGTTSSRAIVFDAEGKPVSVAQKEFKQHYPKPGWVEHDATDIWSSQSTVTAEAMTHANLSAQDIAAVGITNQRETVLLWDRKSGKPVHPAIVWQDRRTADYCGQLKRDGIEEEVRAKTGLFLDPYFSGTKIRWLLDHIDGARSRAEKGELLMGTIDTWLIWRFTGSKIHVTDVTNACRTLLFNIHTLDWDDDLLQLFGIPRSLLPEVKSSSEIYGVIDEQHYLGGVPISGIAGDQQAALFGQACFERGMAKNTYGTGCFLLMNTGSDPVASESNLLTTVAWKIGAQTEYALEGSVFIGGAVVQWLRDELQIIKSAKECDELAATVEDAGGLFLVPAFAGLGAPHWDPYARGVAVGITRGTGRAQFCRAALEGIAFQIGDLIQAMEADSGIELKQLRVDGGASRSTPLLQFQADLLQREVVRPQTVETTALGAAYLAGLGVGFFPNREAISGNWHEGARFRPEASASAMGKKQSEWRRAVVRSRGWVDPEDQPEQT